MATPGVAVTSPSASGAGPSKGPSTTSTRAEWTCCTFTSRATGTSIVDVGRGVTLETIPHGHGPSPPTALQYSNDALRVLSAGVDGKLRLWRVEDDDAMAGAL